MLFAFLLNFCFCHCNYVYLYLSMCTCVPRPEVLDLPGAGVTGGYWEPIPGRVVHAINPCAISQAHLLVFAKELGTGDTPS